MLKQLATRKAAHGRAFNIANKRVAEFLLDRARAVVPFLTGALHDSGRVVGRGRGFDNVQEVQFRKPYALDQHENLTYAHAPGRTAKYLTGPAQQFRQQMQRLHISTMRANVKGGEL